MSDTSTSKVPVCVFIDHSNVLMQGKNSFSSIRRTFDINYPRLLEKVLGGREPTEKTLIVGSYRPQNSQVYVYPKPGNPFWKKLETNGFTIELCRNKYDKEKLVDTTLTTRICEFYMKEQYKYNRSGTIILVAGDCDYEPSLSSAKRNGWNVEVWFWKKGFARSLKRLATKSRFLKLGDVTNDLPPSSRLHQKKKKTQKNGGPLTPDINGPDTLQETMISGIPPTYEKKNIQENGDGPDVLQTGIPPNYE